MNHQRYLVKLQSKKGIFVSNAESGLLPGSLSDGISFRKDAWLCTHGADHPNNVWEFGASPQ